MVVYSVTVSVDSEIEEEWLQWMRSIHIKDVLNTGLFKGCRLLKVSGTGDDESPSYNFQYLLPSMENYQTYQHTHAKALQEDVAKKYSGKFAAFRTVLEVVEIFE